MYTDYLARQMPLLPARSGCPKKTKPLVRLTERKTAAYCLLSDIDYLVDEYPMAVGNKHLTCKSAINDIERYSPGITHDFFFRFLDQAAERFRPTDGGGDAEPDVNLRRRCGAPTNNEGCSFCALVGRATEAVPIEMGSSRGQKTVVS